MADYEHVNVSDALRAKNKRCLWVGFAALILMICASFSLGFVTCLIVYPLNSTNATNTANSTRMCYLHTPGVLGTPFPPGKEMDFLINFNNTIRQANYVAYVVPERTSTDRRSMKNSDRMNSLPNGCYNKGGVFHQGHLVPHTAFGKNTDYMANVVPMSRGFNTGPWAQVERHIRDAHKGKIAIIGCEYLEDDYVPQDNLRGACEGKNIFRPVGCYYTIFQGDKLLLLDNLQSLELIDNGFLLNEGGSTKIDLLPQWVRCS